MDDTDDRKIETWLRAANRDLAEATAAEIDIDATLAQVKQRAAMRYQALPPRQHADLRDALDTEAGLAAISLGTPDPGTAVSPQPASAEQPVARMFDLVRAVTSFAAHRRLTMREHPAVAWCAWARIRADHLQHDLYLLLGRASNLGLVDALNLAQRHARGVVLVVDRAVDDASTNARRDVAGLNRALVEALNLTQDHAREVVLALGRAAHDANTRPYAADRTIVDARSLARELWLDLDALYSAFNDFSNADLRQVDMTQIPLAGLRWSRTTQWPSGWTEQIRQKSVEIRPDVFEIRGDTIDPTTTA